MKNFSDGVSRAVESGKKIAAAWTLALAAATTTQSAVANTVSITDPALTAMNSQNVATETWEASFWSEITLSWLSNPYSENGFALMNITDPNGNLIGVEGGFTRLNAWGNPNWITLTGNEFDELWNISYTGISWVIGLLSIWQYGTINTVFGPQGGTILDTTAWLMALTWSTLIPISDANFSVSRPSAVPAPAAVWLFGSGLWLLGIVKWRRKKSQV